MRNYTSVSLKKTTGLDHRPTCDTSSLLLLHAHSALGTLELSLHVEKSQCLHTL